MTDRVKLKARDFLNVVALHKSDRENKAKPAALCYSDASGLDGIQQCDSLFVEGPLESVVSLENAARQKGLVRYMKIMKPALCERDRSIENTIHCAKLKAFIKDKELDALANDPIPDDKRSLTNNEKPVGAVIRYRLSNFEKLMAEIGSYKELIVHTDYHLVSFEDYVKEKHTPVDSSQTESQVSDGDTINNIHEQKKKHYGNQNETNKRVADGDILNYTYGDESKVDNNNESTTLPGPTSGPLPLEEAKKLFGLPHPEWQGQGVIIGIIDCGLSVTHESFWDKENNCSRILYLWDQNTCDDPWGSPTNRFLHKRRHITDHVRKLKEGLVSINNYDPIGSHGTHVADIAAGNNGVAPKSYLVFVQLKDIKVKGKNLGINDKRKRQIVAREADIREAVTWITHIAEMYKMHCVINMSIGDNGGPHDEKGLCGVLDSQMKLYGIPIAIAAGNYFTCFHCDGKLTAENGIYTKDVKLKIPYQYHPNYFGVNIWYEEENYYNIIVWTDKNTTVECKSQDDSQSGIGILIEHDGWKHCKYSLILIDADKIDFSGQKEVTWTITLSASSITSGKFHIWLDRALNFYQYCLSPKDTEPHTHYCLNSLACGSETVAVGSIEHLTMDLSPYCSLGPPRRFTTQEDAFRPQLFAPGHVIAATTSGDGSIIDDDVKADFGTSLATPFITGIIAIMLSIAGAYGLYWSDIAECLTSRYYKRGNGFSLLDTDALFVEVEEKCKKIAQNMETLQQLTERKRRVSGATKRLQSMKRREKTREHKKKTAVPREFCWSFLLGVLITILFTTLLSRSQQS